MTDSERSSLASELRKINTALGGLIASQENHGESLAEIKARVKETNGRVTALEARKIADEAVESDRAGRRSIDATVVREQRTHRERNRDRVITITLTLMSVAIAAILADVRFF
jgi:hypothetical protein